MLSSSSIFVVLAAFALGCEAVKWRANETSLAQDSTSSFMLVAGTSSSEEVCLLQRAGGMHFDSCSSAVAVGDGQELWSLRGGRLMNVASKNCATLAADGTSLSLSECSGASPWKFLSGGQLQVGGEKCLSQRGDGAGMENVAAHAAVAATSSADFESHSAAAAVDADDATFWASKPGQAGPVSLTVHLGEVRDISLMKIAWEFPAKSFAVSVSTDGKQWSEVFSTTTNVLKNSHIPLSLATASSVRVEMRQTHSVDGHFFDQPLFGIRSLSLLASRLEPSLEDCATAALSKDARDKYFAVSADHFDPAPAAALRAASPALDAAQASLSAALCEIADASLKLSSCSIASLLSASEPPLKIGVESGTFAYATDSAARAEGTNSLLGAMSGIDEVQVKSLLASARATILDVRDALR